MEAMMAAADGASPKELPILLYGDLDLWILDACNLPNMGMISEHLRRFFAAYRPPFPSYTRPHRTPHHRHPKIITSDPYITVSIVDAIVASTRIIPNSQDPKWNEHFKIPLTHHSPFIVFHVMDNDIFGADELGTVSIPVALITSGDLIRDWYPILGPFRKSPKPETALLVSLQYGLVDGNLIYMHGITGNPEKLGMRDTYFPVLKGGSVMVCQDAHVREGELPEIELEKGMNFEHNRCWEDIYHYSNFGNCRC